MNALSFRVRRLYYAPVIDLTSMTSMDDCGICKCGWFSKASAAASCDSASTNEYNMMSFLVSDTPPVETCLVLPPAPVSVIILAWLAIHRFHSPRIFSSATFRTSGAVCIHSWITDGGTRYKTRNFFIFGLHPFWSRRARRRVVICSAILVHPRPAARQDRTDHVTALAERGRKLAAVSAARLNGSSTGTGVGS